MTGSKPEQFLSVTADQVLVREINKTLIFDEIKASSPVSRAELGKRLGLVKGTVSSLVSALIEEHLVYECGQGVSSGGRKPVMLMFNHQSGYAIGIDIRVDCIIGVVTALNGNIVVRRRTVIEDYDTDFMIGKLRKLITALIAKTPASPHGVVGIGIAFPGLVNESGEIIYAPTLKWSNVPLASLISMEFKLPTVVINEARAGAMSEIKYEKNRTITDLVYVSIGPGVGTGIIINNELYRGAQGYAGEAGHSLTGRDETNGQFVTWQQQASVTALCMRAAEAGYIDKYRIKQGGTCLSSLLKLAGKKADIRRLFNETAEAIGQGIINLIYLFNPGTIVIGGEMASAELYLSEPLESFISRHTIPRFLQNTTIRFSQLGEEASMQGAAAMAVENFYTHTRVKVS